ncbi:hypothetical protein [Tychonema sp. BBK16]|uniref:hypothetical protein n=1 Tax=Tychonema sp. BBK16 TaxID=2699888 RepID=UPI001F336A45|nr:hypothetical protein [Tychonema sp. BBK16]MCF6372422.1 hypothetical protein [Tychonema sp. BBK16]
MRNSLPYNIVSLGDPSSSCNRGIIWISSCICPQNEVVEVGKENCAKVQLRSGYYPVTSSFIKV